MSIEAMSWALAADVGSATRKLVLIGYANHAHRDGRHSYSGKDTVAAYANCDNRTVRRHVQALIAAGWMREGDQAQVDHLRGDRRPVVYDLAMSETTRAMWELAAATGPDDTPTGREDNVSPRPDGPTDDADQPREDNLTPRPTRHGGTQPCPPRGDTAVSPEPSLNQVLPPQPPASGGSPSTSTCNKPGPTPHQNCRSCGTTNRQLDDRARRATADRIRATEQARIDAARAEATRRTPADAAPTPYLLARRTLAGSSS